MRDIKFRCYDLSSDKKSMFFNCFFKVTNKGNYKWFTEFGAIMEDCYPMQYTGLKDKNRKEIYEGDIINLGDINIKYVVEWLDCGLKARQLKNQSCIGLGFWKKNIEVIGNIFENIDMLH